MPGDDRPVTPERIGAVKERDIDLCDIPEIDEAFWRDADLDDPERREWTADRFKRPATD